MQLSFSRNYNPFRYRFALIGVKLSDKIEREIHNVCEDRGIDPCLLAEAVFTERYTEVLLRQKPRPEQIATSWGLWKLKDYLVSGKTDNPISLEMAWVERYKPPDNIDLYSGIVPNCLLMMRKRELPFLWLIRQDEFVNLVYSLPRDVIEDVFGLVDIKNVTTRLRGVL